MKMYEWIYYYYYYYYLVLPLIFCKAITGPNFCKATTGPAAAADAAESIIIDQNWRANGWIAKIYSVDNRKSNWLCSYYNVRAFRTAGWDCEVCDSVGMSFYTFWLERRRSLFRWLPRNVLCLFCSKFTTLIFFFFLVRVCIHGMILTLPFGSDRIETHSAYTCFKAGVNITGPQKKKNLADFYFKRSITRRIKKVLSDEIGPDGSIK